MSRTEPERVNDVNRQSGTGWTTGVGSGDWLNEGYAPGKILMTVPISSRLQLRDPIRWIASRPRRRPQTSGKAVRLVSAIEVSVGLAASGLRRPFHASGQRLLRSPITGHEKDIFTEERAEARQHAIALSSCNHFTSRFVP